MSDFLFDEFSSISSKQWKQKIQAGLKGADYTTLIQKTNEGIDIKPFYHRDEFTEGFIPVPGLPKSWNICQSVFVDDVSIAQKLTADALSRGAESILFVAKKYFPIENLLSGIDVSKKTLYFKTNFLSDDFCREINRFSQRKNTKFVLLNDVIHHLASTGNWFKNMESDFTQLQNAVALSQVHNSSISVNMSLYQNAGANIVQQLAYTLAHAAEYLHRELVNQTTPLTFYITVGSHYFMEIAKLRALRILYATLAREFNANPLCHILAVPTSRNKTLYDYNVNMLRTTTECMSAILGGANAVCNRAYDALYHKSNEFGERISRNQLLLLKNESCFEEAGRVADGTYYIESLTKQIAEKALSLFKDIEKSGGLLKQLKLGLIQKKIKESSEKEQKQFDLGERILIGSNKYPNPADRMKEDLELYPFVKVQPKKTLIEPIIEKRLAEKLEQKRLKNEV